MGLKDAAREAGKSAGGAVAKGAKDAVKKGAKEGAKKGKDAALQAADRKLAEGSDEYQTLSDAYHKGKDAYQKGKKVAKGAKNAVKGAKNTANTVKNAYDTAKAIYHGVQAAVQVARTMSSAQLVAAAGQATVAGVNAAIGFFSTPVGWVTAGVLVVLLLFALGGKDGDSKDAANALNTTASTTQITATAENATERNGRKMVVLDGCATDEKSKSSGGTSTGSGDASDADWTKEGTKAYENAKKVFMAFVNHGTSGEFAAGVVGWVNSEGSFDIIGRAQGHYGGGEKDSIKNGAVPTTGGTSNTLGGGGIFQFDPYTRYAPLNSPDWEDADKMVDFVLKEVARGDWIPSPHQSVFTGGKTWSFREAAQLTNPGDAAFSWNAFERGNPAYIRAEQKKADAEKAAQVFHASDYKFDAKKFDSFFGDAANKDGGSSGSSSSSSSSSEDECGDSDSAGGGASWGEADGTGSVNYSDYNAWRPDALPDDLKKYAINPESVGMKFASGTGWQYPGNQCVNLTISLIYAIWEKDGGHPTNPGGNGKDIAPGYASQLGGSTSDTPHAGSAFSSDEAPGYGHTGVVSHVFSNGDALIIEQNFAGKSGEQNGENCTWNYRYCTKSFLKAHSYSFFDPSSKGYKFVSGIKSK